MVSVPDSTLAIMNHKSMTLCLFSLFWVGWVASISISDLQDVTPNSECGTVYFLFMIYDTIYHQDLWNHYLGQSSQSNLTSCLPRYEVFVHRQNTDVKFNPTWSLEHKIVPTVHSYYCNDLVSPMIQLLAYAMNSRITKYPPTFNDVFIFISGHTIPVKPFETLYHVYTSKFKSKFCITDPNQWAKIKCASSQEETWIVKHHQWVALTVDDARMALNIWTQNIQRPLDLASAPASAVILNGLKSSDTEDVGNLFDPRIDDEGIKLFLHHQEKDTRAYCRDEFWFYAALRGYTNKSSPLAESQVLREEGCHTYVYWGDEDDINSAFYVPPDIIKGVTFGPVGPSIIIKTPIEFWQSLKQSKNFFFARKCRETTVTFKDGAGETKDMSLLEAFKKFHIYSV